MHPSGICAGQRGESLINQCKHALNKKKSKYNVYTQKDHFGLYELDNVTYQCKHGSNCGSNIRNTMGKDGYVFDGIGNWVDGMKYVTIQRITRLLHLSFALVILYGGWDSDSAIIRN